MRQYYEREYKGICSDIKLSKNDDEFYDNVRRLYKLVETITVTIGFDLVDELYDKYGKAVMGQ